MLRDGRAVEGADGEVMGNYGRTQFLASCIVQRGGPDVVWVSRDGGSNSCCPEGPLAVVALGPWNCRRRGGSVVGESDRDTRSRHRHFHSARRRSSPARCSEETRNRLGSVGRWHGPCGTDWPATEMICPGIAGPTGIRYHHTPSAALRSSLP